jgi:hypothetical protein
MIDRQSNIVFWGKEEYAKGVGLGLVKELSRYNITEQILNVK